MRRHHTARLFFHTTLEDARLSTALVAVVSYMDRKTLADPNCKQHHNFFSLLDKCVSIHPSFGMLADCTPKYIRFNALARQHKVAVHTERTSAVWDLPTAQYMMRGEQRIVTSVSPHHSVASYHNSLQQSPASAANFSHAQRTWMLERFKTLRPWIGRSFRSPVRAPKGFSSPRIHDVAWLFPSFSICTRIQAGGVNTRHAYVMILCAV